jgi:hypothetical protein
MMLWSSHSWLLWMFSACCCCCALNASSSDILQRPVSQWNWKPKLQSKAGIKRKYFRKHTQVVACISGDIAALNGCRSY